VPIWRALLAGLLVFGLGAGLVYAFLSTSPESPPPPALVTTSVAAATTRSPVTVTVPTSTSSTSTAPTIVSTTIESTPPVLAAMQDALSAWGVFATTGLMRDLGDHFVVGGPQRRLLRAEASAIQEDAPGPPAYVVATGDVFTISATTDDVVLRAEIEWAREGEPTQSFTWDIQMRRVDGGWRLHTVEDVTDDN